MVHGLGGAHVNWVRVAPGLAGLGRVLALDLPGFGRSPRLGRGSGMMDLRRTLSRFVEALGSGDVVLSGNSMGGVVSMIQAAVEPDSVHALVLTGAGFPRAGHARPHPLVWTTLAIYETPQVGRSPGSDPHAGDRRRARGAARDAVRGGEPGRRYPRTCSSSTSTPCERTRTIPTPGRRSWMQRDRCSGSGDGPTPPRASSATSWRRCSCCTADATRWFPRCWAEAALRDHPAWRGRIFPDLGHVPMLEAPGRWLAEVADWHAERGATELASRSIRRSPRRPPRPARRSRP